MAFKDEARFYTIDGKEYPSVTTILSVIDKSGPLMHWAVNEERKKFELALLDVLTGEHSEKPEEIWNAVKQAITGKKAMKEKSEEALNIGQEAHAWIEWHLKKQMNLIEPEPQLISEGSKIAVMWFEDWAKAVHLIPVAVEMRVYSHVHEYAGRIDLLAYVEDILSVLDWKTGKSIYPESFLQNMAYREACFESQGYDTKQGIIVRLPKTLNDPGFEIQIVPDTDFRAFLAAKKLWEWKRLSEGKKIGSK